MKDEEGGGMRGGAWWAGLLVSLMVAWGAGPVMAQVPGESVVLARGGGVAEGWFLAHDEVAVRAGDAALAVLKSDATVREVLSPDAWRGYAFVRLQGAADRAALAQMAARLKREAGLASVLPVVYRDARTAGARGTWDRRVVTGAVTLRLAEDKALARVLGAYPVELIEQPAYAPEFARVVYTGTDFGGAVELAQRLEATEPGVLEATVETARAPWKRNEPVDDPLFPNQWHLSNRGLTPGGVEGEDANVVAAWQAGATGRGVTIAIVDDGVQIAHPDLAANVRTGLCLDVPSGGNDPSPTGRLDGHGTACAGVAAAVANNGRGGAGVAHGAGLAGVRLLVEPVTDSREATALAHRVTGAADGIVMVSSNSWGPADTGTIVETFGPLTEQALLHGVTAGRGGLGVIYVWAAGNGRCAGDSANFDGYASSRHTIAVAASGADGLVSHYSEPGAAVLVNAPSNHGSCAGSSVAGITTTDLTGTNGYASGDYTGSFGGTSSAAPLVAGVVALMLEANPALGWRDVQHVLGASATRNDPAGASWVVNGAGRAFSHDYGFGRVDAAAAVGMAAGWIAVPANLPPLNGANSTIVPIPDANAAGIASTAVLVTGNHVYTEHVEATVTISHGARGDLLIELISPSGMVSRLASPRGDFSRDYTAWKFTSLAHWGENPAGTWTLRIADTKSGTTGSLLSWSIAVHGFDRRDWAIPTPTPTAPPTTPPPSPTATTTPTPSPTPAPTTTPTATPSPSPSPTPTPVPTPTSSPHPTATPVVRHSFTAGAEGWQFRAIPPDFVAADGIYNATLGSLDITARDNTRTFSWWESPRHATGLGPGLYRATHRVSTNELLSARVPLLRLRMANGDFHRSTELNVASVGDATLAPTSGGRTYIQYLDLPPGDAGDVQMFFDMLNVNPQDSATATLSLMESSLDFLGATAGDVGPARLLQTVDPLAETPGFAPATGPPLVAPAEFARRTEGLAIRGVMPGEVPAGVIFGYWSSAPVAMALVPGRLYEARWRVGTDAPAARGALLPNFRLRLNDATLQYAVALQVNSSSANNRLPSAGTPVTYSTYFQWPAQISEATVLFAFDYILNPLAGDDPTVTVWLEVVEVMEYLERELD